MELRERRKERKKKVKWHYGCKSHFVSELLVGINIMVKMISNNIFLVSKGVLIAGTQSDMSEDYGHRYVLG